MSQSRADKDIVAIYLGFDSSTQSLTATAIEVNGGRRTVLFEKAIAFDEALPAYGTRRGVLPSPDPRTAVAPPLMWAEALDRMMAAVRSTAIDLSQVRAISGSAQQHGSVYLTAGAGERLARLDPEQPIVAQIQNIFSRRDSPIWMDSSTSAECRAITEALGGSQMLARLTGSRAYERFTGPQIRKFAASDPAAFARTERIHLVSSYLASLLAGRHAPLEPADASGMNLMDLAGKRWSSAAIRATAPGLEDKLPELRESWHVVSPLAPYWVHRYGFSDSPPPKVIVWSGDNPCSLIGVGLVSEGRIAISLGTSDTVFGLMKEPRVDPAVTGHVFASPTGDFMGLTCFKNGSLARERIRDDYHLDWSGFSAALHRSRPGNDGAVMLPWFEPEITPFAPGAGVRRYRLDPTDASANVRAVIEAQAIAMALHSRWMGVGVDTIYATGGAAVNQDILGVIADVFAADVYRRDEARGANSAALGAALRAYHADRKSAGDEIAWDEIVAAFAEPRGATPIRPRPENIGIYAHLKELYAAFEARALSGQEAV